MVVLDDADPAAVAEAIKIGGYFNSGQDCTASSRILVSERIYDDVVSPTVDGRRGADRRRPGDRRRDRDGARHLGRAAGARAGLPRARRRLRRRRSSRAAAASATAASSSQPTIVADVAQDAEIVQNEVFGPVVTVQRSPRTTRRSRWRTTSATASPRRSSRENVGRAMKVAGRARLRLRLGQRAPVPADPRDAARRLQGVGLRQGHVDLLDGGVHADQARLREARVTRAAGHASPRLLAIDCPRGPRGLTFRAPPSRASWAAGYV